MSPINKLYDFLKVKVKCDEENNPPDMIEKGLLHIDIIVPHFYKNEVLIIPKEIELFQEMDFQ